MISYTPLVQADSFLQAIASEACYILLILTVAISITV